MGHHVISRGTDGRPLRLELSDDEMRMLATLQRTPAHLRDITPAAWLEQLKAARSADPVLSPDASAEQALAHVRRLLGDAAFMPSIHVPTGKMSDCRPLSLFNLRTAVDRDAWRRGFEAGARLADLRAAKAFVTWQPAGPLLARLSRLIEWNRPC